MRDIARRLGMADVDVAAELIRRGCFKRPELAELHNLLAESATKPNLRGLIEAYLHGAKLEPRPAWLAALASADRNLAILAVVNAHMTDAELDKFEKYIQLQHAGHMLRQIQVAIELEQNRRKVGGDRGSRNRITTRRG